MSDYTFLMISLGSVAWVAIGLYTLDFNALTDDERVTTSYVIASLLLRPLAILVGLSVFGLIFIECHLPFRTQRDAASAPRASDQSLLSLREIASPN